MVETRPSSLDRRRSQQQRPRDESSKHQYVVLVSKGFVILSVLSSILVAFAVGRTARVLLLEDSRAGVVISNAAPLAALAEPLKKMASLPDPVLKAGKTAQPTQYTSKTFDTTMSASSQSRWIVTKDGREKCVNLSSHDGECEYDRVFSPDMTTRTCDGDKEECDNDSGKEQIHLPAGQHLLMDIENVNKEFLDSEERLANAMLELLDNCDLTLLSYHCHKLEPSGVSCAGVLLESHVSFHTWPASGVITLDLFTCGPNSLLPIVPLAEQLFAVPSSDGGSQPKIIWAHKIRGFSDSGTMDVSESTDMQLFPIGMMTEYKKEIASVETHFQQVDVYDVIRTPFQTVEAYHKSLLNDGSYESLHPEFFEPDRIVYLDGVLQSRKSGDAAYHEALVHPSMFAHSYPKRVAIIGGGEGATLREVLKHKTVEKVMMVEIDEIMVNVSRQFLPSWSDCSDFVPNITSCFDDPRVEIHYIDAFQWFVNSFPTGKSSTTDPFDIIIMDALDPQVQKDFVNALYDGSEFLHSLPNALSDSGIFTAQVGADSAMDDPAEYFSLNRNRVKLINSLSAVNFQKIRDYNDGAHSGFESPWQIIVAFKDRDTIADWLANPSLIDVKIHARSFPTTTGDAPFKYFDGSEMQAFQYPSKQSESIFCRGNQNEPECVNGHGFDPERQNLPLSEVIEVRPSSLGERAGRGVFAKIDIPAQSYVGLDKLIHIVYGSPHTYDLIAHWNQRMPWVYDHYGGEDLEVYFTGYGHVFSYNGRNDVYVDSTIHCFVNHACNAANNVGHNLTVSEATADPTVVADEILEKYTGSDTIYNPALDRQVHYYSSAVSLRDISADEELFDNYVAMSGKSLTYWKESISDLRAQCEGEGIGRVKAHEEQQRTGTDEL